MTDPTDDLRPALRELALDVEAPPLDLVALRRTARRRRRSRRVSAVAAVGVVLLAAPFAWSAVPEQVSQVAQSPSPPPSPSPSAEVGHVSGLFAVSYDTPYYDARAADAGELGCSRLPGARPLGDLEDRQPPRRGFRFAGTTQEQQAAQACLQAVPAALVTFEPDPAFAPVTASSPGLGEDSGLMVTVGPVRRSAEGWREHDLVLTSLSDRPLTIGPLRFTDRVEDSLLVLTDGCAYADGAVDCGAAELRTTLRPRASAHTTVRLLRDLAGLQALQAGSYTASVRLVLEPEGEPAAPRLLELTYDVLSTATPEPPAPPRPASGGGMQAVTVFFSATDDDAGYCTSVLPVTRTVPATDGVARATLEQLFRGPTPEEQRTYGVGSAFSPLTADLLNSVRVEGGTAYVDLRDFDSQAGATALHNYGTSCGMGAFFGQLETTLRQFSTIREVRYAFDGDPRAFVEYMQGACPDDPIPPGDACDPAPFRR